MSTYSVAIIGTGPDPNHPTVESFAMGYRHAEAYRSEERCEIVACCDVVPENAAAFADEFDVPDDGVFEDYERMLSTVEPDLVSVCVPPDIHVAIVVGCAESGAVEGIHCEKPMANTIVGARRMVEVCDREGVQLTFNRQRRFGKPFTEAKRLLDEGTIGDLRRVEIGWGDFFDTGAHTVDLAGKFNDEHHAEWVIGQLDYREEDLRFGTHQENQMWAQWRYENGVYGAISTGEGDDFVPAAFALRGTEGDILIDVDDGPMLAIDSGGDRTAIDVDGETLHNTPDEAGRFGSRYHDRAVAEIVDALETGGESELRGELGLKTAEIIFAGYESVRRRGRVEAPVDVDDNPLVAMVEDGLLTPAPAND